MARQAVGARRGGVFLLYPPARGGFFAARACPWGGGGGAGEGAPFRREPRDSRQPLAGHPDRRTGEHPYEHATKSEADRPGVDLTRPRHGRPRLAAGSLAPRRRRVGAALRGFGRSAGPTETPLAARHAEPP